MRIRSSVLCAGSAVAILLMLCSSGHSPAAEGDQANPEAQTQRAFRVWNLSTLQRIKVSDYPGAEVPLKPIRLTGVRSGTFAATVGVADGKPIRGLTATPSDLRGTGTIPASSVRVRYAVRTGNTFDALEDEPPAEVPVMEEAGGSLIPLWIQVRVPKDAAAGDYRGAITVRAEGGEAQTVPLEVRVEAWTLPPPSEYVTMLDFIQSPESVALGYEVPMWSEAHLRLLGRSFDLLTELGCKTLYVTAVRRTHFGNEHALVRWIFDEEGELTPDFTIVEKYLDVALKRLGKIPGVVFCCWEPRDSAGHADLGGKRIADKAILVTVLDPESGELSPQQGPAWGTPEAKDFWRTCNRGFEALMKKHGIETWMYGLIGDARPSKQAMDDITTGATDPKWAVHSHLKVRTWQGHDVAMDSALWGIGVNTPDPKDGYGFGWSNPWWLAYYARQLNWRTPLIVYRTMTERMLGSRSNTSRARISPGSGARGLGRIGADFWPVLKDRAGNPRYTLVARYPEASWGQLRLTNSVPAILGKGKNGAVPTVRSEQMREGLQEIEARVYLERVWLDSDSDKVVGEEMLGRIRDVLDARIRAASAPKKFIAGTHERAAKLFALAAEVAAKYGDRQPNPNLTVRNKR